ncbi:hypothetical protein ES703_94059 [subsurface metagenome]
MKNYTLFTAVVPFARPNEQSKPIIVTVPNNAIPLQTEYLPTGQVFHFLVPCDEKGVPIEEVITPTVYEAAWGKLYKLYGERLDQGNLDIMDSVLREVKLEMEG